MPMPAPPSSNRGLATDESIDRGYDHDECRPDKSPAEEDGQVIAMLHSFAMPPRDEAANGNGETLDPVLQPYAELEDPGSLYVSAVAVYPEHRGRGLGRELMAQAQARAKALDLPRISLICFEDNETAMQLYRRLGYVEVDRRPVVPHPSLQYSEGDAVLLVRGLD